MTPAEHYREAERLVAEVVANEGDGTAPGEYTARRVPTYRPWIDATIALAQVHATLALVPEGRAVLAAETEGPGHAGVDGERPFREQSAGEAGLTGGRS